MATKASRRSHWFCRKSFSIPILLVLASSAFACNVPVFRYALERWKSDPYQLVITDNEELSPENRQVVEMFSDKYATNVTVAFEKPSNRESSHVQLRTQIGGREAVAWQGKIDELTNAPLFDSPARRELASRLLAGQSVVWILIRSKDKDQTSATSKLLSNSFKTLADKVSMPEGIGIPGSELYSEVPLLMKFSLLEIDPNDPQENVLCKLLTSVQPEAFSQGEPLVVPVFGRGRALEVIPSSILNENLIEDLTLFLSGACSCQVKERNPGFDLPMSVDWETELFGEDGEVPPDNPDADPTKTPRTLTIPPGRKATRK
jgi:hypothetical protein